MAGDSRDVRLRVLGELQAEVDGVPVELGGPRQRAVLGRLVLARGAVVPVDEIVEAVWGDAPPPTSTASLHSFVSNLRRSLRSAPGAAVLVRESVGYALRLDEESVDAWRFEQGVRAGAALLSSDPAQAATRLEDALALWRGTPLLDYRDAPWAEAEIARLTGLRTAAREHLLAARLEVAEPALLVPELQGLVDEEPLREERWRLLVLALYRAGRQADALAALRRARQVLADELGVDPGPELRELEQEVLAQAPSLRRARPAAPPAPAAAPTAAGAPTAATLAAPPPSPSPDDDLVEREPELRALDRALADAVAGEGRLVVVRGPAGIGKSRLLTEVRRRAGAAGLRVLRARGSELEREFGFGAVRQLFEPLLASPAERERLLSGAAASAAPVFDLSTVSAGDDPSFATLHALYWLTVNAADSGPLLLSVDDLHWCDPGSLRFLSYLLRRLEGLPVTVLGAIRTGERFPTSPLLEEMERDLATEVLSPGLLTRQGVHDLVRRRLGDSCDPAFGDVCFDTTSGNPLLLRQLLRALEVEGVRPDSASADHARALGSRAVSSMVLLRLRRLPPSATAVARAVAVLGDGAGLPAVAALAELPEIEVAVATDLLAEAEILRPEPPLGFVHALLRDAVYRDLAPGERQLAHETAARLLDAAAAPAEQVAAQLLHAPRRADAWAVEVLRRAAAEAMRRGAPDGAIAYLRRALDEPPPTGERADVLLELGLAETLLEGPSSLPHLEEAYAALADPERKAAAAVLLARTLVFAGPPGSGSLFAGRAAADLAGRAELADEQQALIALARVSGHMHGLDASTWGFGDEPEVVGTGAGARMLQTVIAWERLCQAAPVEQTASLAAEAMRDGVLLRADSGLMNVVATFIRDLADEDVLPLWEEALAFDLERGSLFGILSARLWRGMALWRRGDLLEAEDSLRTAIEQLNLWQNAVGSPYAESFLVRALIERAQLDAAEAVLARERFLQPGSDGVRLLLESTAELRLAQGRPDDALALLDESDTVVPHVVNPAWREGRATRVKALLALDRREEAVAVAEDAVALARRFGVASTTGVVLRVLGVAQGPAGVAALRESVALLGTTHRRLELAHSLAALADAVEPAEALALRREALVLANACSADALRDRLQSTLISAGVPAQQVHDDLAALTSVERRVARLLAVGADSVAVAQALFLTPTAAERQVAQVRSKLARLAAASR